jgi:HEAT repeat protein
VSLSASVAIASIDPNRSIFSLSGAVEGLIRLLSSENKELKRAAIRSLGQVGVSTGLSPLAKVLLDTSEKADIRADAAWGYRRNL